MNYKVIAYRLNTLVEVIVALKYAIGPRQAFPLSEFYKFVPKARDRNSFGAVLIDEKKVKEGPNVVEENPREQVKRFNIGLYAIDDVAGLD